MDAANGAATATISNGGTTVTPTDRTAVDTLVGRNITDYTTPEATALRERKNARPVALPSQASSCTMIRLRWISSRSN